MDYDWVKLLGRVEVGWIIGVIRGVTKLDTKQGGLMALGWMEHT